MTEQRRPARPSGYQRNGWQWQNTVARIIKRDRGICYICHTAGADTVDHVTPVAQGGRHHDGNLKAAHRTPCHADKTERERLAGIKARARRRPPRRNPNIID